MKAAEQAELAKQLVNSGYWNMLLFPLIKQRKEDIEAQTRVLIRDDAPKNKFSVISGEYLALEWLVEEVLNLSKRSTES